MHRVVGIIACGESSKDADEEARGYLDAALNNNANWIDWYQGVKESNRWDLKESPDKPILLSKKIAVDKCKALIIAGQRDFNEWYLTASQLLEKNGLTDLEDTCSHFRIACGGMSVWLFDATEYSGGYLRDFELFEKVKNHAVKNNNKLWLCLYDTHN